MFLLLTLMGDAMATQSSRSGQESGATESKFYDGASSVASLKSNNWPMFLAQCSALANENPSKFFSLI